MTKLKAERAFKKLKLAEIDCSIYENYSGRGMYDRTTYGLVVNRSWDVVSAYSKCKSLKNCARDGMGLGTIFY